MAQAKDPVCGMTIEESDAVGTSHYKDKRYYFCSHDCKKEFDENPEDYIERAS
ncbi:MAG: YHS domain-containing protein [Vicinamibacterales bacterium]